MMNKIPLRLNIIVLFLLVTTLIHAQSNDTLMGNTTLTKPTPGNWVIIPYGGLIDRSTFTHSGETVGNVIQKIASNNNAFKNLVQQYLEPYSILCHDKLLSTFKIATPPLVNILAHYPIGSEQPAWVDLFREGHFQLYYNANLIRVFLKGTDPKGSFKKYRSVIRLPIQDVMNTEGMSIKNIEVYVFTNDYATTEISLNTIPITYAINDINLSPKRKSIDLDSIEEFLESGVILEAVEVDKNNNLFFYGRKASNQTIADKPVSISDIAVVYRSVFHYGYNSPYISLDKHEDNRYAKVNFGGHLENTHVGYVVLEADKLFKTLCTGIDPNTHELVKSKITKDVPGFLTENEREFLEDSVEGHSRIRFWFYPDNIGTVTDGSIGTVLTYQFLADAERLDVKIKVAKAVRETIDHLNTNFIQYEKAENTYKELSTVGRIMALINWLREMNMGERIELDDLLSVKIPAFSTPEKTKRMLVITAGPYSEDLHISSQNVRDYTKTYYISYLLDKYPPSTSNEEFLEIAKNYFSQIDTTELYPPKYKEIKSEVDYYEGLIDSNNEKLELMKKEIEGKKEILDSSNSSDIDQCNNLINNYNNLSANQESLINVYKSKINELNSMDNIQSQEIDSIGGGISLNPKEFKRTVVNRNSPELSKIVRIKSQLKSSGNTAKSGDWIRSNSGMGGARINKLPHSVGLQ
ncbi:MAG: hypothetical protein V2A65_08365 [Candidatus Omnitrophota bacterium]